MFFSSLGGLPSKDAMVGLVAGTGDFPRLVAQAAQRQGYRLLVAAIERTDGELKNFAAEYGEYGIGEGGRILDKLKKSGVRGVWMAGGLPKKKLLVSEGSNGNDDLTRSVLAKMPQKGDDRLLRAVTAVLAASGIRVLNPAALLKESLTPKGSITSRELTDEERAGVDLGRRAAKAIGRLDIGQTVVVKSGAVIAVEAVEGTDAVIRRVGDLGIRGAVLVKVSKPQQDLRFDMPVVGLETVKNACEAGIAVLAIEAGKSLFLEREEAVQRANSAGLALVGI